jgi:prepilin-type N-terminal cleavage/methylation domain-containing protein
MQNRPRINTRAFTLIELLVAIGVSVVLLSILAFVFKISTAATRDANARVALTERMRSLNIRLRQEIGSMLPVQRLDGGGIPYPDRRTFEISPTGDALIMSTTTVEDGRSVSVDVKYEFLPDPGGDAAKNVLVRSRDNTGPYDRKDNKIANPLYLLGDNGSTSWLAWDQGDVMVTNVRFCKFEAVDVPAGMPGGPAVSPSQTTLSPRELPSAVRLRIEFGADTGNQDMIERAVIEFPVYRGL